ncbi:hypothetical protein ECG_09382 [Echinococcus granulosus]|nr:hypothetical protein ECG_09382 [Echinococcus granulosus]
MGWRTWKVHNKSRRSRDAIDGDKEEEVEAKDGEVDLRRDPHATWKLLSEVPTLLMNPIEPPLSWSHSLNFSLFLPASLHPTTFLAIPVTYTTNVAVCLYPTSCSTAIRIASPLYAVRKVVMAVDTRD